MILRSIAIALSTIMGLAACATSPANLKQPEYRSSVTVPQPYQLALKRIVEGDRECAPAQLVPIGQVISDVQNYPDLRMGTITKGASGVGTQIYQVIEVHEVDAGTAEIILFTKANRDKFLRRLERWSTGDTSCKV
jgi:hypothetical protein